MDKSDEAEAAVKLNQPDQPPEYTLPPPRIWPQYIVAIAATLSTFTIAAADTTSFNFNHLNIMHYDDFSRFYTVRYLGASLGASLLGLVAHFCGRKRAAVLINLLLILALSIGQITFSKPCLYLGGFILGTAYGGVLAIIPIYVTEIADDMHRGVLGNLILVMSFTGSYMMFIEEIVTEYWLVMLFLTLLSLLALVAAILIPETPPFLISKGRRNEAAKVLRLLRGEYREEWEIQDLESIFSKKASILKPFMISLGLMTLQTSLHIDYSMLAVQRAFMEISYDIALTAVLMVLFGTVCLFAGAVAVYCIKWRLLLLLSCIGTTVGSLIINLRFLLYESPIIVPLGGFLTIASFYAAAGYLPHIVMAQLLPRKSNAITFSMITALCLLLTCLQQYIFNSVADYEYSTILCLIASALLTIYVFLFIPELNRKPVQIIQDELSHK